MSKFGSIFEEIPLGAQDFPLAGASDKRQTVFRQHRIGPIQDQGDEGICVGCTCQALLQADPIRQKPYDAREIYEAARKITKPPKGEEGAHLTSAILFLKNQGIVKEDFWTLKADVAANYIFTTSPIALSIPWHERMDTPESDGRCNPKGGVIGFHAVLGYSYDALKKRIWFQNSWGKKWGQNGCFYLTFKDFNTIMGKGGIACAVEE